MRLASHLPSKHGDPSPDSSDRLVAGLSAIAGGLIALYLAVFVARNVAAQGDFRTYLLAARAALVGLDPYGTENLTALAGHPTVPFVYPPIAVLPFIPLTALPFTTAAMLWIGLKVVLLVTLVLVWRRSLLPGTGVLPLALVTVFGWNGSALWDLRTGNVALLECALLWGGLLCFASGRRLAFALLVVAVSCFKITPIVFLLLLLVPTRTGHTTRVLFVGALAVALALLAGPYAFDPAQHWQGFLRHLPPAQGLGEANPSGLGFMVGLVQRLGLPATHAGGIGEGLWAAFALLLLTLSLPLLRENRSEGEPLRWVMTAAFLYVAVAPRPMAYGYVLLAPAVFYFAPGPFRGRTGQLLLALTLSAQGLTRAANHQIDSLPYVYAPFLLTACIWLLVLADQRRRVGSSTEAAGQRLAA